ncbi:hypothetical protein [Bacillus toyonensis]|uniref:hypothetical protein n=1 Tax=Bacillus toyonensis TaxID=155322 RepID=UPI00211D5E49|nr:hypothetical protein [Bacillus toyonensis]
MIASNGIVDIRSKKQTQEFTMEMTKQMLHETVGFKWARTTQSFLSGTILYIKAKYKEQVHLSELKVFVVQSEKKDSFLEYITSHLRLTFLSCFLNHVSL